jgi:predicted ATPase
MGKTRLAIQAAREQDMRFAQDACFVDLAPITSAERLAETILHTLQAPAQGVTEPDQQVMSYLADKQMLLVLDNYEQLLTGPEPDRRDGYGLVTKLLGAAPRVKLLVTSRARLNVRAEWLAPLEGLEVPGEHVIARSVVRDEAIPHSEEIASLHPAKPMRDSARNDAAVLEIYSATALFLACVRRVQPDFRPTAGDARCIVRICRLLEGSPLAIELAAAWLRALPLAQIERELEHGLDLLATTMRDVPQRHRSMTAAFDHSWRLLSSNERSILRQLHRDRSRRPGRRLLAAAGCAWPLPDP